MTAGRDEARFEAAAEASLQRVDLRRYLERASTRRELRARRRLATTTTEGDLVDLRAERFLRR